MQSTLYCEAAPSPSSGRATYDNLGRSFHLQVIAEGVETREQFLALQAQNCAEGQGYYFQRPIDANEFAKLLGADLSATVVARGSHQFQVPAWRASAVGANRRLMAKALPCSSLIR